VGKSKQEQLEQLKTLLKDAASLELMGEFLRKKGLPHSAKSWDVLFASRISPSIDDKKLQFSDLERWLTEAEEHGHQHVFLFKGKAEQVKTILDRKFVTSWAKQQGLSLGDDLFLYEMPSKPKVCNVRIEIEDGIEQLVVRVAERRASYVPDGAIAKLDGQMAQPMRLEVSRAINVFRLKSNGQAELRIHADRLNSNYKEKLAALWKFIDGIALRESFQPTSLEKTRANLERRKDDLQGRVRYQMIRLRHSSGTVLTGVVGSERASLFDDPKMKNSIESYVDEDSVCSHSNVCWKKQDNNKPSADVRVRIAGEINEFGVTGSCGKSDYNYVLSQILHHAK
jgi:hypothetical protein